MSEEKKWLDELWEVFPSGFTLIMVYIPSEDEFNQFINDLSFIEIDQEGDLVLPENVVWKGFLNPSGEIAFYLSGDLSSQAIDEVVSKAEEQHFQAMPQSFGDAAMANMKEALKRRQGPPVTASSFSPATESAKNVKTADEGVVQKPQKRWWQFWK